MRTPGRPPEPQSRKAEWGDRGLLAWEAGRLGGDVPGFHRGEEKQAGFARSRRATAWPRPTCCAALESRTRPTALTPRGTTNSQVDPLASCPPDPADAAGSLPPTLGLAFQSRHFSPSERQLGGIIQVTRGQVQGGDGPSPRQEISPNPSLCTPPTPSSSDKQTSPAGKQLFSTSIARSRQSALKKKKKLSLPYTFENLSENLTVPQKVISQFFFQLF